MSYRGVCQEREVACVQFILFSFLLKNGMVLDQKQKMNRQGLN